MTTARILPFRMLLDEGMKLTRSRLRQLYLPFALPMVGISVLTVLAQLGMMQRFSVGDMAGGAVIIFAMLLVAMLSYLVYVAVAVTALDVVADRAVDFRRAYLFALRPRAFGTLLLIGILVFFAFLACLVPAFYVIPLLSFCLPAMVEEGRYGSRAIERSVELAGLNPLDNFPHNPLMRAFALVVVGMVLSWAISFLIQLPFEILRQVLILRDIGVGEDPFAIQASPVSLSLQLAGSVLGVLASTVLSLYISHCSALLYHDTVRRREGGDLEAALGELDRMAPGSGDVATAPAAVNPGVVAGGGGAPAAPPALDAETAVEGSAAGPAEGGAAEEDGAAQDPLPRDEDPIR
ncbi:MAG: hypothetical protein AAF604_18665 [Acidobacteriota bacterium]